VNDPSVLGYTAIAVVVLMTGAWLVSRRIQNVSIVDIIWGSGFAVIAIVTRIFGHGVSARQTLLTVLVAVWGVRLSTYLFIRNHGKPEDFRYAAMRRRIGPRFALISLFTVFLVQGALMWVVSLPVQLGQLGRTPTSLGLLDYLGALVWLVGVLFESIGDAQLARFKADPANQGMVMDRGLWSWTRHPNYFGDFCIWWGLFLVAASTVPGRYAVVGPLIMTALLMRYSGAGLLEKSIGKRRPGYAEYAERTSMFFPRPPRRATS
jgi:steroid 5-alpha reductase family enzyme